jgi:hypothetical protein
VDHRDGIVKEFVVLLGVMNLLTVGLAVVFGSPDRCAITLAERLYPHGTVRTGRYQHHGDLRGSIHQQPNAGQKLGPLP